MMVSIVKRFLSSNIALLVCAVVSSPVSGQIPGDSTPPLYLSYFEIGTRLGNEFNQVTGDLFLPTLQDDESMLYLDIRGTAFESGFEGNFGLGLRHITDCDYIFGVYAYLDRMRSPNGNYFSQATLGLELMDEIWDFRANAYLPEREGQAVGTPFAEHFGGTIVVRTPEERAYHGGDVEIGYLLAGNAPGSVELRAFATGFHFSRDVQNYKDISGGRARLELRLYDLDWLGEGSRLMLGAQYQYDRVRGDVASGLLTVRVPLGPKPRRPMNRLQRRMLDRVVRDPNIISNETLTAELAVDPDNGSTFGQVFVADATTSDIPGLVTSAGSLQVILDGSRGPINLNQSIVLQNGQTLRGAGFTVTGKNTGNQAVFGGAATVNGTNNAQDVVVLASNSTVKNLTITGGQNGVFGNNTSNIEISDNSIRGAANSGVQLSGTSSGTIDSNRITQNGIDGLTIDRFASGTISNNHLNRNSQNGLTLTQLDSGTLSNIKAFSNTNAGISISTFVNGTLQNSSATGSNNNGIVIANLQTGTITGNSSSGNGGNGIRVTTFNNGTFSANSSSGNGNTGISIEDLFAGSIANNTSTGNQSNGIFVRTMTGGTLSGNLAQANDSNGIRVDTIGPGVLDGNTSSGNNANGFLIADMLANSSVINNASNGNAGDGFDIGSGDWSGGNLDNNASTNNAGFGFLINNRSGGTAANNTASGNADNTLP